MKSCSGGIFLWAKRRLIERMINPQPSRDGSGYPAQIAHGFNRGQSGGVIANSA